jgi:multisubunit Na+/H+ antiporter MnhB subunit
MAIVWLAKMAGLGADGGAPPPLTLIVVITLCFMAVNTLPSSWDYEFKPNLGYAAACAIMFFIGFLFMNGRGAIFLYYHF